MREPLASWQADTDDYFPPFVRVETVGTEVQITVRDTEGGMVATRLPGGAFGDLLSALVANWRFPVVRRVK